MNDPSDVLFVCVHNAGRSQMAAGLVKLRSAGRVHVRETVRRIRDEIDTRVQRLVDELLPS